MLRHEVDIDDILELVGIPCDSVGVKKYDIFKFENKKKYGLDSKL